MPPSLVVKSEHFPERHNPFATVQPEPKQGSVQLLGELVPRTSFAALVALREICGGNRDNRIEQHQQSSIRNDPRFEKWVSLAKVLKQPYTDYSVTRPGVTRGRIEDGIGRTMELLAKKNPVEIFALFARGAVQAEDLSQALFVVTNEKGESKYLRPLKTLGRGATGTVALVEVGGGGQTVDVVAMKGFHQECDVLYKQEVENMRRGATITAAVPAPKDLIECPTAQVTVFFMPFREGVTLKEFVQRVGANRVDLLELVSVTHKLIGTGLHLAERRLLPTDTHGENILVHAEGADRPTVHFIDFTSVGSQVDLFSLTLLDFFEGCLHKIDNLSEPDVSVGVKNSGVSSFCRQMIFELRKPQSLETILTSVSALLSALRKIDCNSPNCVLDWISDCSSA